MTARRRIRVSIEAWPLVRPFTISRGSETVVSVVLVECRDGGFTGRGEATPYGRYDETPESVVAAIESARDVIERADRPSAAGAGLRGAAANAVDCALIDLACKQQSKRAWDLLGLPAPRALPTTVTISLDTPANMAAQAKAMPFSTLVKVKLGAPAGDLDRVRAVRGAVPRARIICDANEGWSVSQLEAYAPILRDLGVELIEQPLPANSDDALAMLDLPIPICADESCHTAADVDRIAARYDAVNIKLDKAGGLTGALALVAAARRRDMIVMVGCMLGTSLAMAPGLIAAQGAEFVDLDGPLALTRDRDLHLVYRDGMVLPPDRELWG